MRLPNHIAALSLAASPTLASTWSLWFNGYDNCRGNSYQVTGTDSTANCHLVDIANIDLTLKSVQVDTDVPAGYCKLILYQEIDCRHS